MPTYETIFITVPNLAEDDERGVVDGLAEVVTGGDGQMVSNDRMGRRRLAYPIRKFEDGVYTRFLYDSDSAVPTELERRFRLSDKILRHLTVRLEPGWAEAAKQEAVREAKARAEAEARAAEEARRRAAEEAEKAAAAAEQKDGETAQAEPAPAPEGESGAEPAVVEPVGEPETGKPEAE